MKTAFEKLIANSSRAGRLSRETQARGRPPPANAVESALMAPDKFSGAGGLYPTGSPVEYLKRVKAMDRKQMVAKFDEIQAALDDPQSPGLVLQLQDPQSGAILYVSV